VAEGKLHLHWRLAKPASGEDNLAKLKKGSHSRDSIANKSTACAMAGFVSAATGGEPGAGPVSWSGTRGDTPPGKTKRRSQS
jgi:hypothetical protein